MLTGYNSDVVFEDCTFHVQSEDRGVNNPVIETLVYCGGRILHQLRTGYEDLIRKGKADQRVLSARLEHQHRDILRRARHGEFFEGGPPCLRSLIEEDRPLEELLLEFIASDAEMAPLRIRFDPLPGGSVRGQLLVTSGAGGAPAAGARILAHALGDDPEALTLLDDTLDDKGLLLVDLEPPPTSETLVFRAERGLGIGRLHVTLPHAAADGGEPDELTSAREVPAESRAAESVS
ncbi:MAG: hypothetical protein JSV80_02915 [Acidobacteriota bacterium]|nr:MAG: hypothetical protein JSV80_02915 [Acidobacteriota bacterium]